jgi:hypothetical protein
MPLNYYINQINPRLLRRRRENELQLIRKLIELLNSPIVERGITVPE